MATTNLGLKNDYADLDTILAAWLNDVADNLDAVYGRRLTGGKTWDPPSIADGAVTTTTVTVTGAAVGDRAVASLSTLGSSVALLSAHVSAADTVLVVLLNKTGGALDLASGTLNVDVWRT